MTTYKNKNLWTLFSFRCFGRSSTSDFKTSKIIFPVLKRGYITKKRVQMHDLLFPLLSSHCLDFCIDPLEGAQPTGYTTVQTAVKRWASTERNSPSAHHVTYGHSLLYKRPLSSQWNKLLFLLMCILAYESRAPACIGVIYTHIGSLLFWRKTCFNISSTNFSYRAPLQLARLLSLIVVHVVGSAPADTHTRSCFHMHALHGAFIYQCTLYLNPRPPLLFI